MWDERREEVDTAFTRYESDRLPRSFSYSSLSSSPSRWRSSSPESKTCQVSFLTSILSSQLHRGLNTRGYILTGFVSPYAAMAYRSSTHGTLDLLGHAYFCVK